MKLPGGDAPVAVRLPATKDVAGVTTKAGTMVYPDAAASTDVAAQATKDGGVRTLVILKDGRAAKQQRFGLELPEGTEIRGTGSGEYDLLQRLGDGLEKVLATIGAPWAKDANGKEVATRYRIEGHDLVQEIDADSHTAYPVVADPKLTYGKGVYFNARTAEWKAYASIAVSAAYGGALYTCTAGKLAKVSMKNCK